MSADARLRSDALRIVQIATNTVGYVNTRDVDRVEEYLRARFGPKPKLPPLPTPGLPPLPTLPKLPPLPR